VRLNKNLLKNALYRVDSISDWIRHMRVGGVHDEFNGLQRVADSIVHPLDSFETTQPFDFLFPQSELPMIGERKGQCRGDRASNQTEWTAPVHPVVIDEPLQEDDNTKHK